MTAVTSEDQKEIALDRVLRDASEEDRITLTQGEWPFNLTVFRVCHTANLTTEDVVDEARNRYLSPTWFQKVLDNENVVEPIHAWQIAARLGVTSQTTWGGVTTFKCRWVDKKSWSHRSLGEEILREYPTRELLNRKRARVLAMSNHGLNVSEKTSLNEAGSHWWQGLMESGLSEHRAEVTMLDEYEDWLEILHQDELSRSHLSQIDRTLARWGEIPYRKVEVTIKATLIDHTGVEWEPEVIGNLVDDCLCETFPESLVWEVEIETQNEKLIGGVK